MQPLWYGDRRDRVKWGALLYLAERFNLSPIIQVAFWRDETVKTLKIGSEHRSIPLSTAVWKHFSDLRTIERLAQATSKRIVVIDDPFEESRCREYIKRINQRIVRHTRPKLLFLDPDTGIQPDRSARAVHATITDVRELWTTLTRGDLLAIYQHASRRRNWMRKKQDQLRWACKGSRVFAIRSPEISKDVAMLWTRKA